jgi:hypothetical protein
MQHRVVERDEVRVLPESSGVVARRREHLIVASDVQPGLA